MSALNANGYGGHLKGPRAYDPDDRKPIAPAPCQGAPPSDLDMMFVTEDPKCADLVCRLGLHAVAPPITFPSLDPTDWAALARKPVFVLCDSGLVGEKFAKAVATRLAKEGSTDLRMIILANDNEGVSHWLKARQSEPVEQARAELERLASQAVLFCEGSDDDTGGIDDAEPSRQGKADRSSGRSKEPTQIETLLEVSDSATLFHTPDGKPYASFCTSKPGDEGCGRVEHHTVRSSAFKGWLTHRFYRSRGTVPSRDAIENAFGVLAARAQFDGPTEQLYIRVAPFDSDARLTYYVDIGDPLGGAVEITSAGWKLTNVPPVKFRRPATALPLPVPERGGSLEALRQFVNIGSDQDFKLFIAVLTAYLRPTGPYPLLVIQGEQGSAKSTTTRIVSQLIDPIGISRSMPRDEHSLAIAATNSWVLTMDNLSGLPVWLSDALCRLSTGGGFATRTLYSSDEETVFNAMRPIVLNGIEDIAERPDLLDRSIVVYQPTLNGKKRMTDEELNKRFNLQAPMIFGALLDACRAG
jgi:hypothetical protein